MSEAVRYPVVRRPNIDYENADIPRFYYRNSKVLTNFWNVFHAAATVVEGFFIRDGNKSRDHISDPVLLRQVDKFVRQEAQHSSEHNRVNKMLEKRGYPIKWAQERMLRSLERISGDENTQLRLAVVVAGEHFLGELGYLWLVHGEILADMDETMAELFAWHGYEEFEHHHVAIDTYNHVYGRGLSAYLVRLKGIYVFAKLFFPPLAEMHRAFNRVDGVTLGHAERKELFRFHFVNPGFTRRLIRKFIPILSPWFHPNKYRDVSQYLNDYRHVVKKEWEVPERPSSFDAEAPTEAKKQGMG